MGWHTKFEAKLGEPRSQGKIVAKELKEINKRKEQGLSKFSKYNSYLEKHLQPLLDIGSKEALEKIPSVVDQALLQLSESINRFESMHHLSSDEHWRKFKKFPFLPTEFRIHHKDAQSWLDRCNDEGRILKELKRKVQKDRIDIDLFEIFDRHISTFDVVYQDVYAGSSWEESKKPLFERTYDLAFESLEKISHMPFYKSERDNLLKKQDLGLFCLDSVAVNWESLVLDSTSELFHAKASILGQKYKKLELKTESYGLVKLWVAKHDLHMADNYMANLGHCYLDLEFSSFSPIFVYSDYLKEWIEVNLESLCNSAGNETEAIILSDKSKFFNLLLGAVYLKQDQFDDISLLSYQKCAELEPDSLIWREGQVQSRVNGFQKYAAKVWEMPDAEIIDPMKDLKMLYDVTHAELISLGRTDVAESINFNYQSVVFRKSNLISNMRDWIFEDDRRLFFSKSLMMAGKLRDQGRCEEGIHVLFACLAQKDLKINGEDLVHFMNMSCSLYSDKKTRIPVDYISYFKDWITANQKSCVYTSLLPLRAELEDLLKQKEAVTDAVISRELELIINEKQESLQLSESLQVALGNLYFSAGCSDKQALDLYDHILATRPTSDIKLAVASLNIQARNFHKAHEILKSLPFEMAQSQLTQIGQIQEQQIHLILQIAQMLISSNTISCLGSEALKFGIGKFRLSNASQRSIKNFFGSQVAPIVNAVTRPYFINIILLGISQLTARQNLMLGSLGNLSTYRIPLFVHIRTNYDFFNITSIALSALSDLSRFIIRRNELGEGPQSLGRTVLLALPRGLDLFAQGFGLIHTHQQIFDCKALSGLEKLTKARFLSSLSLLGIRAGVDLMSVSGKYNRIPSFLAARDILNEQTIIDKLVSMTVSGYFSILKPAAVQSPFIGQTISLLSSRISIPGLSLCMMETGISLASECFAWFDLAFTIANFWTSFKYRTNLHHIQLAHRHFVEHHKVEGFRPLQFRAPGGLMGFIYETKYDVLHDALMSSKGPIKFALDLYKRHHLMTDWPNEVFFSHFNKTDLLASYAESMSFLEAFLNDAAQADHLNKFMIDMAFIVYHIGSNSSFNFILTQFHQHVAHVLSYFLSKTEIQLFYSRFPLATHFNDFLVSQSILSVLDNSRVTLDTKIEYLADLKRQPSLGNKTTLLDGVIDYLNILKNPVLTTNKLLRFEKLDVIVRLLPRGTDFKDTELSLRYAQFSLLVELKRYEELKTICQELSADPRAKIRMLSFLVDHMSMAHGASHSSHLSQIERINHELFDSKNPILKVMIDELKLFSVPPDNIEGYLGKVYEMNQVSTKFLSMIRSHNLLLDFDEITRLRKQRFEACIRTFIIFLEKREIPFVRDRWLAVSHIDKFRELSEICPVLKVYADLLNRTFEFQGILENSTQICDLSRLHLEINQFLSEKISEEFQIYSLPYLNTKIAFKLGVLYMKKSEFVQAQKYFIWLKNNGFGLDVVSLRIVKESLAQVQKFITTSSL